MNVRILNGLLCCQVLVLLGVTLPCRETQAQNGAARQLRKRLQDAPLDQLNEAIHAQADLMIAEAETRRIDAELSQKLLDVEVDMKVFRAYWQKKAERKEEERKDVEQTIENQQLGEVKRRAALKAQWESLFNTERMQIAKLKGTPQNLMLALLNERTQISYSSSLPSGVKLEVTNDYNLDDEVLRAIRVSSPTLSGKRMTFALTDPVAIDLSWWPTLLQHNDFSVHRDQVTEIRKQLSTSVTNETGLDLSVSTQLEENLTAMTKAFFAKYPPGQRKGFTSRQFHLVFQAEDFLRRLDRDVTAVVVNGSASPVQGKAFDRQVDGENVATLVSWMLRNNLRLEEPAPADAGQYARLFEIMKGFCVACDLAPNNEWIEAASADLDLSVE